MIINEWLNYYEKAEIVEMLKWNRYMYDDHAKRGALPPYKTVGKGLERIFPKKEFWIWAASREVAMKFFLRKCRGFTRRNDICISEIGWTMKRQKGGSTHDQGIPVSLLLSVS